MSSDDIIKIIDAIPEYIRFIYPGYLVMYLYSFFRCYTLKDSKNVIIKSVAISFILNLFTMFVCKFIKIIFYLLVANFNTDFLNRHKTIDTSSLFYNICLVGTSVFVAYASYRVIESEGIGRRLKKLHIDTSTYNNEFKSLKKGDEYTYIRIYLKDKPIVYEGYLIDVNAEHDVCKSFLIIDQYSQFYINESAGYSEELLKAFYNKKKEKVLIYFDNIDRIEKCGYKRIDILKKQKS